LNRLINNQASLWYFALSIEKCFKLFSNLLNLNRNRSTHEFSLLTDMYSLCIFDLWRLKSDNYDMVYFLSYRKQLFSTSHSLAVPLIKYDLRK